MIYVCLFMPALISVLFYEKIAQVEISFSKFLQYYGLFNVLNNLFIFMVVYYLFNNSVIEFTLAFCIKYLIFSLLTCFIMPIIVLFVEKNFEVRLNVKKKD